MSEQMTIRDALLELRRLIDVTRRTAEENLKAFTDAVSKAQESFHTTAAASEAVDRITSQLGFSVALERAASDERPGNSAFPGGRVVTATVTESTEEEADEEEKEEEEKPRRRRRRRQRTASSEVSELREKIVALRRTGNSQREIARRLNIGHATVWRELSKLPEDPLPAAGEKAEEEEEEIVSTQDPDPRFRFKLKGELAGSEAKMFNLMKKNYPDFTTAGEFTKKHIIGNDSVAAATITRLRQKDVPIESAKQARERGQDIAEGVSGWRLIVDE